MRKRKAVKRYIVHGAYIETKHCIYCLQKMKVNLCSHQRPLLQGHIFVAALRPWELFTLDSTLFEIGQIKSLFIF